MTNRFVHAGQEIAINLRAITANDACYSTHFVRDFAGKLPSFSGLTSDGLARLR
jgi:hypothetical protein